jgi:hypothetical protein
MGVNHTPMFICLRHYGKARLEKDRTIIQLMAGATHQLSKHAG